MSTIKVLITRPEHDDVVKYLSDWSHDILIFAKDKGITCKDLGSKDVNRKEFEKVIKNISPSFVMFNGHGFEDRILGHKDEPLIIQGENEHLLKDMIVYAVSCNAGASLGSEMVEKGCNAFIGYKDKFAFLTDNNRECIPEEDELALPFKEASNEVPHALIKGNAAKVAYDKSQNKCKELIKKYSSSDAALEAASIRFWLFWNMENQVIFGNPESKI